MKRLALWIAFIGISGYGVGQALALENDALPEQPREVMIGISDAYIPTGLNSQSDAYVVVSGIFPNGCYRWSRAEVDHSSTAQLHQIQSFALVKPGMCLMVLVPFTKQITLGQMTQGTHTLRFLSGDGTYLEKHIEIE